MQDPDKFSEATQDKMRCHVCGFGGQPAPTCCHPDAGPGVPDMAHHENQNISGPPYDCPIRDMVRGKRRRLAKEKREYRRQKE